MSRKTAKKKAKKRFDGSEEDTGDGRDNGEKRKRKVSNNLKGRGEFSQIEMLNPNL